MNLKPIVIRSTPRSLIRCTGEFFGGVLLMYISLAFNCMSPHSTSWNQHSVFYDGLGIWGIVLVFVAMARFWKACCYKGDVK